MLVSGSVSLRIQRSNSVLLSPFHIFLLFSYTTENKHGTPKRRFGTWFSLIFLFNGIIFRFQSLVFGGVSRFSAPWFWPSATLRGHSEQTYHTARGLFQRLPLGKRRWAPLDPFFIANLRVPPPPMPPPWKKWDLNHHDPLTRPDFLEKVALGGWPLRNSHDFSWTCHIKKYRLWVCIRHSNSWGEMFLDPKLSFLSWAVLIVMSSHERSGEPFSLLNGPSKWATRWGLSDCVL